MVNELLLQQHQLSEQKQQQQHQELHLHPNSYLIVRHHQLQHREQEQDVAREMTINHIQESEDGEKIESC